MTIEGAYCKAFAEYSRKLQRRFRLFATELGFKRTTHYASSDVSRFVAHGTQVNVWSAEGARADAGYQYQLLKVQLPAVRVLSDIEDLVCCTLANMFAGGKCVVGEPCMVLDPATGVARVGFILARDPPRAEGGPADMVVDQPPVCRFQPLPDGIGLEGVNYL